MTRSTHLPVSGQRIAASVLTTHTTPEQRDALLAQIAQLRSDTGHLIDIARPRIRPCKAEAIVSTLYALTNLIECALFTETVNACQAAHAQGAGA